MRSRTVILPFAISLSLIPLLFFLLQGFAGKGQSGKFTMALFAATVLLELFALTQVISARKLFSPDDSGHLTWTLIMAFLIVRLLAEGRLVTMNFGLTPKYSEELEGGWFIYLIVFRYLYTVGDVLFIAALVTTIRAYKSTGLKFGLMGIDYFYIAIVWTMPLITYAFRGNLIYSATGIDPYIPAYRLTAVTVGALIATLCLVVRRYVVQMGGGAVARVWSTVVIAGIARAASFLALALLTKPWKAGADFIEQYLLWIFAGCWLIAALYQQEVLPRQAAARVSRTPETNPAA